MKLIRKIKKQEKGVIWIGILIIMVFLTAIGATVTGSMVLSLQTLKRQEGLQVAQALAEAGVEKALWKLNRGDTYSGGTDTLPTGEVTTTISDVSSDTKVIEATGCMPDCDHPIRKRTVSAKIGAVFNNSGLAFRYGVQVGSLGLIMDNNAKIIGNVYSGGDIKGGNNGSSITGDAFVSGAGKRINKINIGSSGAPGNGWAEFITQSNVWGNAKVKDSSSLTGTTVHGDTTYAAAPPNVDLPISDSSVGVWEGWAAEGTNYGGLTINANQNLGPAKIDGNLVINGGVTVTITGTVWVTGNVYIYNGAIVKLASSFGNNGSMIIADRPTDRDNYGKITVENNVKICGSYSMTDCMNDILPTNNKSYIMLLSTKNATTIANPAIRAGNNANAAIYYTSQGMLEVSQNAKFRAMSGGGLHLSENSVISYDIGMVNMNFSAGPGGSWSIKEWRVKS